MAENVVSIVTRQVGAPAGSWIKDQLCYVYNFDRYVDNFNDQLHNLKLKRERIEHAVDDATRRNMELIERDVEHWLHRVTTLINDKAEAFLRETERAKNGCLFGICPNVKARYQLSKKAEDLSKDAANLLSAGEKFPGVSYRPPPQGIRFPTIKEYETFESRACHFEKIMNALKDPNVNMIGVWGMGGVGKTTLVKKVAEQANVENIFNVVVLSEVSLNQDLKKVQGEIAEALGFKFEAEEISVRSIKLRERLQKETKILVILDNIWEFLDLGELGMPDDHKGCKILMTSRNKRVLGEIGTDCLNFKVDTLENVEAWNLFEKRAGDVVKVPNLRPIANKIAEKCAGLPILIATVARALRNTNDPHTWKEALQQLERFENDDLDKRVHSALELSYNHLGSRMMKQLFLLCGQLVNTDYAIEDLVSYCVTLDAFKNIDLLEDRRNKLYKLVRELNSACLLLDGEKNGYIKMHDLVRKFALNFAREKHNMFIEEYDGELEEWPKNNRVAKFSSICFPHNFIHRLQERLECEELKLFILHSKNRYLEIPSSFFQGVRGIMVLDVKNLIIPSLPSSLCYLKNLCTLSLEKCELEDIGIIGNLVGLEVLRIVNTNLSRLPEEIGQLTRLKLVNVSKCYNLKVIPPNVISSWTRLEELSMEKSFVNWVPEGVNRENASLAELSKLTELVSLNIHIPNSNIMPNYLFSDKLERFKILIGDGWDRDWNWEWSSKYESSRSLKLKLSTRIHLKPDVLALLKKTEDLYLDELVDVNSVSELDREGFPRLRFLHVQNGRNFQYIVNSNTRVPCNIFPGLEVLSLKNLNNLEMICHGQLGAESFNKLRIVKVRRCELISLLNGKIPLPNLEELFLFDIGAEKIWDNNLLAMPHCFQTLREMGLSGCHKLNFLFPVGVVTSLIQLESLDVLDCKLMEEIIEGVAGQMIFPKLRSLHLRDLPELKRFCTGKSIEFPSLSHMWINGCPKLNSFIFDEKEISNDNLPPPLFDEKVKLPTIERLHISSVNLKRIWHNELAQESFCKLDHLRLYESKNEWGIFPSNMLTRLQNLQNLWIQSCKSMYVIFDLEGQNGLEMHITKVPAFRKLKSIKIDGCLSLRYVFPLSIGIGLQELEKLDIEGCGAVEKIVAMEGVEADVRFEFSKLTYLRLRDLPELRSFYPGIHTPQWPLLKNLEVVECGKLKITASESWNVEEGVHDENVSETSVEQPLFSYEKEIFPPLEELSLSWNYNSKQMWHGEFQFEMLRRLKSLVVIKCHDESFPPPGFFKRLPNLEELSLSRSTFDEISPNGEAGEPSTFCTLKILTLTYCDRLKILFLSSLLSFCNLSELKILHCDGLTDLMSCSTAKRMMRLENLNVYQCKMMTSIIECVGECEAEDHIIFRQLKQLEIGDMPNIASVSGSAKHAFQFPSLEDVSVASCPNLKTFCEGPLSTFKLRSIRLSGWRHEELLNGDLNTTIQTLYKEKMIIRIQRRFRRHVVSRDFIAFRRASIVIQSIVRGHIARQMFESLKGDIALN